MKGHDFWCGAPAGGAGRGRASRAIARKRPRKRQRRSTFVDTAETRTAFGMHDDTTDPKVRSIFCGHDLGDRAQTLSHASCLFKSWCPGHGARPVGTSRVPSCERDAHREASRSGKGAGKRGPRERDFPLYARPPFVPDLGSHASGSAIERCPSRRRSSPATRERRTSCRASPSRKPDEGPWC